MAREETAMRAKATVVDTKEDSHVGDSEVEYNSSDSQSKFIVHDLILVNSQSDDSLTDSDSDNELYTGLDIVTAKPSTPNAMVAHQNHQEGNHHLLKRSNMGKLFDVNINQHIERLSVAQDDNTAPPVLSRANKGSADDTLGAINPNGETSEIDWTHLQRLGNTIKPHVFQLLKNGKLFPHGPDWYFIVDTPSGDGFSDESIVSKNIPTDLLKLGVPQQYLSSEFTLTDSMLNKLDSLAEMYPIDYILDTFTQWAFTNKVTDQTVQWFILLILDLNVYNSIECDLDWCESVFHKLQLNNLSFINSFLQVTQLDKQKYYMIFRLIRQLPFLRDDILKSLFDDNLKSVIEEFNNLLDMNKFHQLLYFLLIILGSPILHDNKGQFKNDNNKNSNNIIQYLKDCVLDVSNGQSNDVELTIIVGLINMFAKL